MRLKSAYTKKRLLNMTGTRKFMTPYNYDLSKNISWVEYNQRT